ncbi:H/ACA ribonucleoprotein complex non-core subunit NAF1 [Trichoderma asperellum]|uniref:H/ACA ribonucleoprotein complex non-core subunit NAF1 n=1 Tax=Trichoderma asperellum TaxID=101201 RepID=A0A6V8QYT6_TRIAP|nr:H/ACA ribonucleoprotein complex non-core subunit NAF1 [Trichoderma asperellum]
MSGFQIPGLGQAKLNEVLPPLPTDHSIAAANAADEDKEMHDANPPTAETTSTATENHNEAAKPTGSEQPTVFEASDDMTIDKPGSPPSLTSALEAALGGLDNTNTHQQPPAPEQESVPLQPDQSEHPEWEIDSSPYESSDSSSSDSSSDDDDDSDNEGYEPLGIEETARILMETEGGSDDEGDRGKSSGSGYVRTKNELPDEIIPKPDVTITPEMAIEELGAIEHIVENIMLVKAFTPGEYQVLDSGSILCTPERVVIGVIAETIGKVLQPMYTVMFNSAEEIKELGLEVGAKVFYPVDHASYVFTEPLKNLKGSDASNLHDEEIADEEIEFSDDEKEAEYKRSLKQKKKDKWKSSGGKEGKQPHPLRHEMLRITNLHQDQASSEEAGGETLEEEAIEEEVQVAVAEEATTSPGMDILSLPRHLCRQDGTSTRLLPPIQSKYRLFLSLDFLFLDGHSQRLASTPVLLRYHRHPQAGLDLPKIQAQTGQTGWNGQAPPPPPPPQQ